MADTKITALTALTAADPASDVLPIVDISDTTMAASGTTKKISVNNILGAGGTATLASATITGDLTVDTSTLKVDSANNRVGIGTATPGVRVDILSDNNTSLAAVLRVNSNNAAVNTALAYDGLIASGGMTLQSGASPFIINTNGANERYRIASDGVATWSNVGGVAGTAMTLNSTGLGVGATVYDKITALNTIGLVTATTADFSFRNSGGTVVQRLRYTDSDASLVIGSASAISYAVSLGGNTTTRAVTIDASSNVGIGVTPSAWLSSYKSIDILAQGSVFGASNALFFGNNVYVASGGVLTYKATSFAAYSSINNAGQFTWNTAPSGTGGTAATFTQAMTLDSGGNLLVGTTAAAGGRLDVQTQTGDCTARFKSNAAGSNTTCVIDYVNSYGTNIIKKSGTDVWLVGVIADTGATPNYKIQNGSAVGVQLVSGATAWTTLSDETLKDIIEPISNAVSKVGLLRSVIGKFKTDDASKRRSFLIAQDVQSVLPEAVDVIGENNELGLRYTEVIPLLVAAIKELTARVQTLETR